MTAVEAGSLLLKLIVVAIILSHLLLWIRLPILVYRLFLPVWKRIRYQPALIVAIWRIAIQETSRGHGPTAIQLWRDGVAASLRRPTVALVLSVFYLASALSRFGHLSRALPWYSLADSCTPDDFRWKPQILLGLGGCLSSLGKYDEADAVLDRAWHLRDALPRWARWDTLRGPLWSPAYRRLVASARAYAAMQAGRFEDARRWYEAAHALPGTRGRVQKLRDLSNLAAANQELGNLTAAEDYIRQAEILSGTETWPGQHYLIGTRGRLRLQQARLAEARADLTTVLMYRGADTYALLNLAEVACAENAFDEAASYIDAIQSDPTTSPMRAQFAGLLGRVAAADRAAGRLLQAEKRQRRAEALRKPQPTSTAEPADSLLGEARATLAGKRYLGVRLPAAIMVGSGIFTWAFLMLSAAIFLLPGTQAAVILLEAVLLVIVLLFGRRLARTIQTPKQAPAAPALVTN